MIKKALIPAAGLGTRFLPATKAMPKEMLPVAGKPVIQHVVEEALAAGITDILLVISRTKRLIEEHFDRSLPLEDLLRATGRADTADDLRRLSESARIHYVWQAEPLGLGHAVLCGRDHIGDEPFALLLGDTLFDPDDTVLPTQHLLRLHAATGTSVIALERIPPELTGKYGIADAQACDPGDLRTFRISGLVEKPAPDAAPSTLAVAARYVLTPDIFDLIARTPPGKNNEIQITDAIHRQAAAAPIHGYRVDATRLDIGNPAGFVAANLRLALADPGLRHQLLPQLQSLLNPDPN